MKFKNNVQKVAKIDKDDILGLFSARMREQMRANLPVSQKRHCTELFNPFFMNVEKDGIAL